MKKIISLLLLMFFGYLHTSKCVGQTENKLFFEENKNQFPSTVQYKADLNGCRLFLEKDKFTYVKYSLDDLEKIHDSKHSEETAGHKKSKNAAQDLVRLHSFQATFINSNTNVRLIPEKKSPFYTNYFVGNDSKKWASEVYSYEKIIYKDLYQNIDLATYSKEGQLKYDFIIQAGTDPEQIRIRYDSAEQLYLKNNTLIIKTSIGDIVESIPLAYQTINNKQVNVSCLYRLNDNNTITFYFPNGYNSDYSLVIDPILVAATYSGATTTADTYGHCATYDNGGNIYTGGECHASGYPASTGAYQTTFSGQTDIVISKLNPNGSSLIWATYIGGSNIDIPNSLFVNNSGEIYVLGASNSTNYPVSAGCFDNSQNGSEDIVVTHLNATGTALIGSTYIGGSGDEGRGWTINWMNAFDGTRGEIIVDQFNNAWIASYTSSTNFPTTTGAYDQTFNGGVWDACVFKLSSNMSSLLWGTFLGGVGDDVGYGVRLNTSGEVYVTGVTSDNTFPATAGAYQSTFQGGASDGYVTKFNATGSGLSASTFIGVTGGASDYDASYFIDLDDNDFPYIFGTSMGSMPVTAGVYSNAGSGNFISKLNQNLGSIVYSTVVGAGAAGYLEPAAFMVDTCENVYIAGFGSTSSYPVTSSALYSTPPPGGTCYLMSLSKDAISLLYGSFYFGDHVESGSNRFDKNGTIYLGFCMATPAVTTPAWTWSNGASAPAWDMFVLKMDFQLAGVNAVASAGPNDTICLGQSVTFNNTSNGVDYTWDFGDGTPLSTAVSPTHTYASTGIYTVIFHAIDSSSCNIMDSILLTITVLAVPDVNLGNDTLICGAVSMTLDSGIPGAGYTWSTGATTQTISINTPGTYWVSLNSGSCTDKDTIVVQSTVLVPPFGNDTTTCTGQVIVLDANNPGANYLWSTGAVTQTISVNTADQYWVTITLGACAISDTMNVSFVNYPVVNLVDSTLCPGASLILDAGNTATTYLWSTAANTQTINVNATGVYIVTASNGNCAVSDTSDIIVLTIPHFEKDISLCEVIGKLILDAGTYTGTYLWSTGETSQSIAVSTEGEYWVTINSNGCVLGDTTHVTGDLGGGVIYFPNAFTPNKNGLNDVFTAYGTDITYFHMAIFNRWGELIFETEDYTIGWDGLYKGELSKQDVYVWKIQYKSKCKKELTERIGHVTVVR